MVRNPEQPGGHSRGGTFADDRVHNSEGSCSSVKKRDYSAVPGLQSCSVASEAAPTGYHGNRRRRRWLQCWSRVGTLASAALVLFLPASWALLVERPERTPECALQASSGAQETPVNGWSFDAFGEDGSSENSRGPSIRPQKRHAERNVVQRMGAAASALIADVSGSDSAERLLDAEANAITAPAVRLNPDNFSADASNGVVVAQSMLAVSSDSSADAAESNSPPKTENAATGVISPDVAGSQSFPEDVTAEKGTKKDVRSFYNFFVDPQALEQAIRSYGTDEKFYSIFHPLYKNRAIAQLINGLADNGFEVKTRLSRVVERCEETLASDVEASDLGFMERKRRQEDTLHTGKTGIFIIIFKRLLDWVYGRDFLESAMRDRQAKWKILSRLSEYGVSEKDLTPAQLKAIVELQLSKKKPFKGVPFDPFAKDFPSLDAAALEDTVGVNVKELLKAIEEKKPTSTPETATPLQGVSTDANTSV